MTREDWTNLRDRLNANPVKVFECLYNEMWDKLFSVSYNYVRDRAVAQEIVQDVFVALWVKRRTLQSVSDIHAFTMRAVRNRIYDHYDKQVVQQRYTLRITQSESTPTNQTLEQVEYDETLGLIDQALDKLPDTTRKIFRMSRFEKFSNEQIASKQELSVKAVEYHITQALKHLRVALKYTGFLMLLLVGLR